MLVFGIRRTAYVEDDVLVSPGEQLEAELLDHIKDVEESE